jgi:hypothetical protein
MTKRTNVEHENEIRKLDCKIHEAEAKEALLTEENVSKSDFLSENKSLLFTYNYYNIIIHYSASIKVQAVRNG